MFHYRFPEVSFRANEGWGKNIADCDKNELTETFTYDDANLLVDHIVLINNESQYNYSYKYDENGKMTELKSLYYVINAGIKEFFTMVTLFNEKQKEVTIS